MRTKASSSKKQYLQDSKDTLIFNRDGQIETHRGDKKSRPPRKVKYEITSKSHLKSFQGNINIR